MQKREIKMSSQRIQIQEKPGGNVMKRQDIQYISMTVMQQKCNCCEAIMSAGLQDDVVIDPYIMWKEVPNVSLKRKPSRKLCKVVKDDCIFRYTCLYIDRHRKKSKVYVARC